jgi:phage gp16-like protein
MNDRFRNRQLAAIHASAAKLGMDDDTYRAVLWRVANVRSAKDLDSQGRGDVLRELARLGKTRVFSAGADAPKAVREEAKAMVAKIGAMLAEANRPWSYAHAMAKRMFNVARVEWLPADQMHRIVAALNYDQQRRRAAAQANKELN